MSELRRDPIVGRWVIISSERGNRPSDFKSARIDASNGFCPFCSGSENKTPSEIIAYRQAGTKPDTQGWWVRVVPNKFPALWIDGSACRTGDGIYDRMSGVGAHEVIVETPCHNVQMHEMDDRNLEDVFWVYRDRVLDLKKDRRFEYILIFKNYGSSAGASLSHPHSQLIASPVIPKQIREEIEGSKEYFDYKGKCIYCDMISQEKSYGLRVALENEDFIVFEPYASRFPFETWVMPKSHSPRFEDITKKEVESLSRIMKEFSRKLSSVLQNPSYNYIIHNSPLAGNGMPYYHWHIEIMPKFISSAGFEWGTGFYINPTSPEDAAGFLREG